MRAVALLCLSLAASPLAAQDDDGEPFLSLDDDVADALGLTPEDDATTEAASQTTTDAGPTPSDLLAECAAILAVSSAGSNSFVERDRLREGASMWFSIAGDVAIAQGQEPDDAAWAEAVQRWAGRIRSIEGMNGNQDWATSCTMMGKAQGLDASFFAPYAEPATPAASEDTAAVDQ